jgi:DNA-binding beta-propeller fold protein YncE
VINGQEGAITTTISVGNSPSGITVDSVANLIYVESISTENGRGTISVIDGTSNTIIKTFYPATGSPFNITLDQQTNHLFVMATYVAYVMDASSGSVLARLGPGLFRTPSFAAVWQLGKTVVISDPSLGLLRFVDETTNTVTSTVADASFPFGIAVDSVTQRIYVANENSNSVTVLTP